MYWNIDLSKEPLKPTFYLCKPNKKVIANITDAYSSRLTIKLKGMNELNFNVPYKVIRNNATVQNPYIHNIRFKYLVKLVYGEFTSYFSIQPPRESDQDINHISVQCFSLEDELRRRKIRVYKKEAATLRDATYDLLVGTNWSVNYIPSEFVGIAASRRTFDITSNTILESLNQIAESFGLIVQYDTVNREINFYKEDEIGANKGLEINDQKYLQSFLRESDSAEFCTRLNVTGKDNLSINRVSLTGESYIEDFGYFLYPFSRDAERNVISRSDYMSNELGHALLDYQDLLFSKKGVFEALLEEKSVIDEQIIAKENELSVIETDLQLIEDEIEVQKQYGNDTTALEVDRDAKTAEMNAKIVEISDLRTQLDAKNGDITSLRFAISKEVNFTAELLTELQEYVIEEDWSDSNQYEDTTLYAAGLDEFDRRKFPPMSLNLDIVNFQSILTEQKNWNKLTLGDTIRFKKEEMGIDLKANLIEASFSFDSDDISIVVSNLLEVNDVKKRMMRRLYKSENASDILDINKGNWNDIGDDLKKYIDEQISETEESLGNLNRDVERFYADGYITKTEANFLKLSLQETKAESVDLILVAESLNITTEKTNYEQSLTELETLLSNWIDQTSYPISILLADRELYAVKFQNVQKNKTILADKIITVRDNALEALLSEQIAEFSNDGLVSLAEANMLETTLASVKQESIEIINVATSLLITTEKTAYQDSLISLETLLNTVWINQASYPSAITPTDRINLEDSIKAVQQAKSTLNNKIVDVQSQAGKDADEETKKSIRNPSPILPPTIKNDGSAIDHVSNKDSSVDISFEWEFTEDADSPINGFGVTVFSSDVATGHTPSLQTDYVVQVDKSSRSFVLTGVTANKYYTFGVVAYRNVDSSINAEGIIRSTIATSSLITESPYRPSTNISYEGDIAGTIGGTPYDRFNRNSETIIIGTKYGLDGTIPSNINKADIIIEANDQRANVAINAAIASIKNTGGIVKFLEGYYFIYEPIIVPSNIMLSGSGRSTIFIQNTPSDATSIVDGYLRGMIENEDGVNGNINIIIRDLSIHCGITAINNKSFDPMRGAYLKKTQECVISGINFIQTQVGSLLMDGCIRNMITNNFVNDSPMLVRLRGSSLDNLISDNMFFGNGGDGTAVARDAVHVEAGSNGNTFSNNSIKNASSGITSYGDSTQIINNKITDTTGTITGNGNGISIVDARFCEINGNHVSGTSSAGIRVNASDNAVKSNNVTTTNHEGILVLGAENEIKGNTVLDSSKSVTNTYSNIKVANTGSNNNNVSNNKCRSQSYQSKYGIEISGGDKNIIKDNDLKTSGFSGAISDAGTGTTLEGNITV